MKNELNTKRLFLAVNPGPREKEKLAAFIAKLDACVPDARWSRIEGLHLTFLFLGEVTAVIEERVKDAARRIVSEFGRMDFYSKNLNAFPNKDKPRILVLDIFESNGYAAYSLQKKLKKRMGELIPLDKRGWHPHLTLGRIKNPPKAGIDFSRLPRPPKVKFRADSVDLMLSYLHPRGCKYEIIEKFPLYHPTVITEAPI